MRGRAHTARTTLLAIRSHSALRASQAREVLALRRCNYYGVVMSRPKTSHKTRTTTAVRFPEELYEQLRQAADERDLSVNYLVVKAVEEFLERLIPADELRLTRPERQAS